MVLATASHYFNDMFNSDMKETLISKVSLDYNKHCMNCLLEYIYSGNVCISEENVEEMIEISTYLQVCNVSNN